MTQRLRTTALGFVELDCANSPLLRDRTADEGLQPQTQIHRPAPRGADQETRKVLQRKIGPRKEASSVCGVHTVSML